jgi:hypothetical protein
MSAPTVHPGGTVIAALLDTVYHRLALLAAKLTTMGFATAAGSQTAAAIANLGYGYPSTLRLAVAYPAPGQVGVPRAWLDNESPDPVPHGTGGVYGYPVTLDFPTVDRLGPTSMALIGPGGPTATWVDAPGRGDMDQNQVALVPKRALRPDAWYTVAMRSPHAVFMDGTHGALAEHWRFRTAAADQSVFVAAAADRLVVAVDDAASDVVAAGVPLRVSLAYRHSARGGGVGWKRLTLHAVTGPDGLAVIRLPGSGGAPYTARVTTQSGGQGVATWPST